MKYKYIEGIYEVNEFYKSYLEQLGMFEFNSNYQNGYITYYEDLNGLEMIAFSLLLRTDKEIFAKCLLPLVSFEEIKNDYCDEKEQMEEVILECSVDVFENEKYVDTLGAGMEFVYGFAKYVDEGIPGSIVIERGWYCNRTLMIGGKELLEFIESAYPKEYPSCNNKIESGTIYKIIVTDLS